MMKDLIKLSDADLAKEISESKTAIQKLRFGNTMSRAKNTKEVMNLKHKIAQLLTEDTRRRFAKEDAIEI